MAGKKRQPKRTPRAAPRPPDSPEMLWVHRTRLQAGVAAPGGTDERQAVILWVAGSPVGPQAPTDTAAYLLIDPSGARSLGEQLIALARRGGVDPTGRTADSPPHELGDWSD